MISLRSIGGVVAFLLTVVSASAFQESAPIPAPPGATAHAGESELGLADEETVALPGTRTGVFPGLPMNFGLELLYGDRAADTAKPTDANVGLTGRLKHSF